MTADERRSELGEAVAAVLRAAGGALGSRDIVDRLPRSMRDQGPAAVGQAAREHPACLSVRRGQYVYMPTAVTGAAVFLPRLPDSRERPCRLPLEALCLLWPTASRFEFSAVAPESLRACAVELPDGRHVRWQAQIMAEDGEMHWGESAASHPDGFLLRCLDGEAGRYALRPCTAPSPAEAAEQEERWLSTATSLLRAGERYRPSQLAIRLLAGGAYHGEPPRATLAELTGGPPFVREHDVAFRPDVTPAMWRLFDWRLPNGYHLADASTAPPPLPPPVAQGVTYRLRAHLHSGAWWAEFDAASEHYLDELHWALQSALRWDNDHLYAFYLSGRHGDRLTSVLCPDADGEGPSTAEITLGHFDPQPGSHVAYHFDFGDDWRLLIEVLARTAAGPTPPRPRRLAMHGRPPVQYPEPLD